MMDIQKFTMYDGSGNTPATETNTTTSSTSGSNHQNYVQQQQPVLSRTGSGLSHDTSSKASIASNTTSGQQTRFSFYNADDFKVTSVIATTSTIKTTNHSSGSMSPQKSPKSMKIQQAVVQTMEAQQQHENVVNLNDNDGDTATDNSNVDSNEILRSLQEHEQQRLDILAGPKRKMSTTGCGGVHSTTSSASTSVYYTSMNEEENNSNPYEEAIKEALQLIRKHRAPIISEPHSSTRSLQQQNHDSSVCIKRNNHSMTDDILNSDATNHFQDNNDDHRRHTRKPSIVAPSQDTNDNDCDNDPARRLTKDFGHLMVQSTRSLPGNSTAAAISNNMNMSQSLQQTSVPTHPVTSNPGLGEAYQAEIEARRRQRQERMARYATRLAELKQEDQHNFKDNANSQNINDDYYDDGIPMVDTARSLDSSVDYGSSGIGRGVVTSRQYRASCLHATNNNTAAATTANIATSRSWEDDIMLSLSRSNYQDVGFEPSYVAASNNAPSNPGSVSTLSNTIRPDDEIQRGVERVLLAILERAHSRGRSAVEGRLLERHHPAISEPVKVPPVPGDEEKKSNDEKHDEVLVQALSDLLGPSTVASGLPLNEENESPSLNVVPSIMTNGDRSMGPAISISASDKRHENGLNIIDKSIVTSRLRVDIPHDKHSSSSEEPIEPVETYSSQFIDTDDDDAEDNPSLSGSDYSREDDDNVSDDRMEDDDDDDDEEVSEEDESRSYDDEDDEVSRSDDYESNAGSESYEKRVLGPLSKRSGGTTGVVLDDYSSASSASYDDGPPQPSSILESLSAAVSRVTGIAKIDENDHSGRSAKGDKYAMDDIESNDESEASTDSEANDLMRSLCAHLLPVAVDRTRSILDDVPEWDESNPDEAGYRIVRLTGFQLHSIEKEYARFIDSLKKRSHLILSPKVGVDDSAFELDLQAAEKVLEEEENKLRIVEMNQPLHSEKSPVVNTIPPNPNPSTVSENIVTKKEVEESECLTCFPGVKPAGKGEMGELEYFSLPIIFKSHVTGFEPTKDIILEPGNVVAGQYLVEGVLGSAAFSTAYKCVDLTSDENHSGCQDLVCLKVIKNTKDFFDQSLDEIKILELLRQTGKCNEKFIVEMKTFFYHREHLIIVTELLRQNLFEFGKFILDSGEEPYFTLPRLSYIARQCFIALEFVHSMGLVHSDVKPENILLASYSRAQAKLIDFGSSCYLTDRQSSYIQSRSYRAPEVVLGLPYDGRIDIWSIGCVIAEMFTGEVTFQNDSVVSMLSRIEAICGPFPRHMIAQGRQSARFFAKCGLLFEKVVNDTSDHTGHSNSVSDESSYDDQDESRRRVYIDIFQPKTTTLAARLGFAPDLMDKFDNRAQLNPDEQKQALFCDLVRKLLTIDPEIRLTATEALNHPAMLYAATLSEADVKYPSS